MEEPKAEQLEEEAVPAKLDRKKSKSKKKSKKGGSAAESLEDRSREGESAKK